MNVLIVLPVLSYRGGERIFYTLAKGLVSQGHQVGIVVGRVEANAFSFHAPIKLIRLSRLGNQLMQHNLVFMFAIFPVLVYLIYRNSVDVEVIDTESGFALWASTIVGKLRRIKVVWTIFAFEQKPFKSNLFNKLFAATYRKIDAFFAKKADGYTCIASRLHQMMRKVYGIREVKVIIPAVDTARFARADGQIIIDQYRLAGRKVLLLPAALHPKKNQELAIYSLRYVVNRFPEAVLILVGDGPDRARLERLAQSTGVQDSVLFVGVAKENTIAHYYAVADLVLVCSKVENEGLSMTALEALANRVLPIVARGAGIAEILQDRQTGVVVEPVVDRYKRAIVSCLAHPEKYKNIIERGRRWVLKELSVENFAQTTTALFQSVLEK